MIEVMWHVLIDGTLDIHLEQYMKLHYYYYYIFALLISAFDNDEYLAQ